VLGLRSQTDPRWIEAAMADFDATLADHAHCEKKAAATAVKLCAEYPGDAGLVLAMAKLAQEEMQHFFAVLAELTRRGKGLASDGGDPYARALMKLVRGTPREKLVDRLLVGGLIEARSCERLKLIAGALPAGPLRGLYESLFASEAGHHTLFLDLAKARGGEAETLARWETMAAREAEIVAALPLRARVH
jgi:tRNA-(ms[2]io[6]A)-hydroxylase